MENIKVKQFLSNALALLSKVFKNDSDALGAINLLNSRIEGMEWESEETNGFGENESGELYPLPEELKQNPKGFAVFSDGACRGNPGPGAWGFMIQDGLGQILKESSGPDQLTTNNKMELKGAARGLSYLLEHFDQMGISYRTPVYLFTDSKYVVEGMKSWVDGWKSRGWKKADKKPPLNLELWQELDVLRNKLDLLKFVWIKGHAGHPQNERCDQLANEELDYIEWS